MPQFPSTAWAEALRDALNANSAYAQAAAAWEGDFMFAVLSDDLAPQGEGVYLDLAHGLCRAARYVEHPAGVPSEFVVLGSREDWAKLLDGRVEPIQAIMDGTFKMRGNMMKAMRFARAAKEMLDTAARIPRE
jgi:putative sterol carrier protein